MKRLARSADIAPHQFNRGAAAEKIEHEHGDIRENGEMLEGRAKGKKGADPAIGENRDVRSVKARMNVRKSLGKKTVTPKGKKDAGRTEDIAGDETER